MKIVNCDNFDRDYHPDKLVCENVPEYYAQTIADALNEKFGGEESSNYFKVVADDYVLYEETP